MWVHPGLPIETPATAGGGLGTQGLRGVQDDTGVTALCKETVSRVAGHYWPPPFSRPEVEAVKAYPSAQEARDSGSISTIHVEPGPSPSAAPACRVRLGPQAAVPAVLQQGCLAILPTLCIPTWALREEMAFPSPPLLWCPQRSGETRPSHRRGVYHCSYRHRRAGACVLRPPPPRSPAQGCPLRGGGRGPGCEASARRGWPLQLWGPQEALAPCSLPVLPGTPWDCTAAPRELRAGWATSHCLTRVPS